MEDVKLEKLLGKGNHLIRANASEVVLSIREHFSQKAKPLVSNL